MVGWIIRHQWKEMVRSILWQRTLVINIFLGILLSLFILNLLSLGLFAGQIMEALFPNEDPLVLANGILLYYLIFDLLLRHFFQKESGIAIRPYLLLPIGRKKLVHFFMLRSLKSLFNFFPLLLIIPFTIQVIIPAHGPAIGNAWLAGIILFILLNNFLNLYLAKQSITNTRRVLSILVTLSGFVMADFLNIIHLSRISRFIFSYLAESVLIVLVPLLLLIVVYITAYRFFSGALYLDALVPARAFEGRGKPVRDNYFASLGLTGLFMSLELKLLFRNKRGRSILILAAAILVFAPLFYGTFSKYLNTYAVPQAEALISAQTPFLPDGEQKVTFCLIPDSLPPGSHVFITGNHPNLGKWKPAKLPLLKNADGSWSRTLAFPRETKLRYIYTLGAWDNELTRRDSIKPDVQTMTVINDTTVVLAHPNWKIPRRDMVIDMMLIYLGILFTGILMISYGQFMFTWESNHLETILVKPVETHRYLQAKFLLMLIFGMLFFLVSLPLAYFGSLILKINTALFLYNLGVNTFVMFFLSFFSRKRFDLNASLLSTQGKGGNQFVLVLPAFFGPILLYLPFGLSGINDLGLSFLAGLGVAGIVFHRPILAFMTRLFLKQKYKMVAGFRQS